MLIMAERVNHPPHYNAGGIECIDALEAATSGLQGIEAFCTANAIKYLWRWKLKNGEEDLQKAVWYINRLIQRAGADSAAGKELFNMKENKHGFEPKQEFTMGGIAWTVIQTGADWVKCIASDCVEERAFDEGNKNDFAASSLRAYLNGEFLRRLIKAGAPEEMFEYFNIDLTADDGLKNYGGDRVRIGLITCEEYRLLRGNIPALPDRWWWTATPDSPINSFVRYVNSDGSLNNNNAYNGNNGVRPLRWKMRSSRHKPKAEYHHQRKVYPVAAIHGGDEYRIADTGAYRLPAAGKGYKQRGFFIMTDFEKIHSFESLYNAYRKARQGKRWKGAAAKFEVNLLEALNLLSAQIRTKRYTMSPYNTFEVYEPKRRVVMSNSYKDKVVQHSLCDNVLEPILTRSFIRDNYASQVGKGTHYGLDRLQEFMRRFYRKNGIDGWILKGDISKYFYSIRHDVLKTLIREKITDPDVLWLIDLIIDSTEGNVGIPIGNQTSQLFALLYLDGLDHFVKEKLGIKYYGRYMDDFFLIHHDKAYLQECRKQIEAFAQARGLSLNAKTNIFPLKHGVDFLGFHTYLTESGAVIRKVRRRSKNNMKRKLKKLAALQATGRIDAKTVEQSYQSWRGHAEKGNSYHLIRRTDHYYNSLMKPKEAAQCQKH